MYYPKQRLFIIFILAAIVSLSFLLPLAISATPVVSADGQGKQNHLSENAWLIGVWGSSSSDVFVVGYDPWGQGSTILHYDGISWSYMNSGNPSNQLGRVWGSSSSDVFAVGYNPRFLGSVILHYDGSTWSPMSSGTSDWLGNVWGSSSSDVFAVGSNGTIVHYNGSTWNPMSSGTSNWLSSVWGSSSSDVFAVGGNGTILHYNGSTWGNMSSGTSKKLVGIWGSSSSDVFAVGDGRTILHYNGNWESVALPTDEKTCIWVIIGPIIAVIVLGLLAYWFLRKRKPPASPNPTTGPK